LVVVVISGGGGDWWWLLAITFSAVCKPRNNLHTEGNDNSTAQSSISFLSYIVNWGITYHCC
jgi:hypothetical protein